MYINNHVQYPCTRLHGLYSCVHLTTSPSQYGSKKNVLLVKALLTLVFIQHLIQISFLLYSPLLVVDLCSFLHMSLLSSFLLCFVLTFTPHRLVVPNKGYSSLDQSPDEKPLVALDTDR